MNDIATNWRDGLRLTERDARAAEDFQEELAKALSSEEAQRYSLSLEDEGVPWQTALASGESYCGNLFLNWEPKSENGETARVLLVRVPLFTPRETMVIRGVEQVYRRALMATDRARDEHGKVERGLSPAEKSRNLEQFQVSCSSVYRPTFERLTRALRQARDAGDVGQFLRTPELFIGGSDFFIESVNSSGGLERFPVLDTINPLAEVEQRRRFVFLRGGRTKLGKDLHPSHYGRLCVVETPESELIGMRLHLACRGNVDDGGAIVTPLESLATRAIEEVAAGRDGYAVSKETEVQGKLLARGGSDGAEVDASLIGFRDVCAEQSLGYAALQIPFIHHNDPARALMGAKNLKQALPLKCAEPPIVCTGYEKVVAEESGRLVRSDCDGQVVEASENRVVVQTNDAGTRVHDLVKFSPSPVTGTGYRQLPVVRRGGTVSEGDVLAADPTTREGVLALGANFLVAYLPFRGLNMDDGIVVGESAAKRLTSVHCEEHSFPLGRKDLLEWTAEEGADLQADTEVLRLSRMRVRKKTTVNIPAGPSLAGSRLLKVIPGVDDVRLRVWRERKLEVGDKLMGRHGNKGIVAAIVPDQEMPFFESGQDGKPHRVEIILNPHGIISRMNLGQLLETHFGWVARHHADEQVKRDAAAMGAPFQRVDFNRLSIWLKEAGLDSRGGARVTLTGGDSTIRAATVGYQYIVKLNHLASKKLATCRADGSRSAITGMPVSGRGRGGGQRLGEMEAWALLGHGAEELLKDLFARRSNAKGLGEDSAGVSQSLSAFVAYLRALAIDCDMEDAEGNAILPGHFPVTPVDRLHACTFGYADDAVVRGWGRRIENTADLEPAGPKAEEAMGYIELVSPVRYGGGETSVLPVLAKRYRPFRDDEIGRMYKKIFLANLRDRAGTESADRERATRARREIEKMVGALKASLWARLKGRYGLIRMAVLGKRVDGSARAVIVPNPCLKADSVEIPGQIMDDLGIKEGDAVLLVRQPSLHIHNLQVFTAKRSEARAIGINPIVCGGFNADFDGDTMAVFRLDRQHPAGMEVASQVLRPADGGLNMSLSQDIAAGIYAMTLKEEGRQELERLLGAERYESTGGGVVDAKKISGIVRAVLAREGRGRALATAEELVRIGVQEATRQGITLSIFDFLQLGGAWHSLEGRSDDEKAVESALKSVIARFPENPVSIMIASGARGNLTQLRQMVAVKGFISRMSGAKTAVPVRASYLTGLSPTEYYLSCYGARKSLGDKKLRTPDCGYLTRRLVFAAAPVRIVEEDCGTGDGIELETDKALGRVLVSEGETEAGSVGGERIIDEAAREELLAKGVGKVRVRSPLTCGSADGLCRRCHGWDLGRREMPPVGFFAGVVAAETIGERATQDAMRTFHTGAETGAIRDLDDVMRIFDQDGTDAVDAARRLYRFYEPKVDMRHFEVMLRALGWNGERYLGTKHSIGTNSILHQAAFESAERIIESAAAFGKRVLLRQQGRWGFEQLFA